MLSKVVEYVSNKLKKKNSMSRKNVIENLGIINTRISNFIGCYKEHKDTFKDLIGVLEDGRIDKSKAYTNLYFVLIKNLAPAATKKEREHFFSMFVEVLEAINTVVIELKTNIDKYLSEAELNEYNMKISHVGILHFLKVAEVYSCYCYFMFNGILKEVSASYDPAVASKVLPKYRLVYLENHMKMMVYYTNRHYQSKVFKDVIISLNEMKSKGTDILINNAIDGTANKNLASAVDNHLIIFPNVNILLFFGTIYNNIVHWWYTRMQKEKEWMEARVNLIRLELNRVDPNSDEYIRLSKIADNYDILIADADRKLNNYFTDEGI